jgi:hypothetical protein
VNRDAHLATVFAKHLCAAITLKAHFMAIAPIMPEMPVQKSAIVQKIGSALSQKMGAKSSAVQIIYV